MTAPGSPRVLVVTARGYEAGACTRGCEQRGVGRIGPFDCFLYVSGDLGIDVVVADVGSVPAAVAATSALAARSYDLAISAGIAGGFPGRAQSGEIVVGSASVLADLVVEGPSTVEAGGAHGWRDRVECVTFPGCDKGSAAIRVGEILTISRQTSLQASVQALAVRHPVALAEAMEGAGVGLAASIYGVPFLEIRAISNIVGVSDRTAWRRDSALDALANSFLAVVSAAVRSVTSPQRHPHA